MEILIFAAVLAAVFFGYQVVKTANINKLCFKSFPIWLNKYIYCPPGSIDKATLAKSFVDQSVILAGEMNTFSSEDYQEISTGFKRLGPGELIHVVDGWIEEFLPVLDEVAGPQILDNSSARFIGVLMLVAATSVNPSRSLRDFLGRRLTHAQGARESEAKAAKIEEFKRQREAEMERLVKDRTRLKEIRELAEKHQNNPRMPIEEKEKLLNLAGGSFNWLDRYGRCAATFRGEEKQFSSGKEFASWFINDVVSFLLSIKEPD